MTLWRIAAATRAYAADDLSGSGAGISPGRWNSEGSKVVYCATTRALAVLETAAHLDDHGFPLNRFLVAIDMPGDVWRRRDIMDLESLDPQWSAIPAGLANVDLGTRWLRRRNAALLELPSVIVPEENIVLVNPDHPDASKMSSRVVRKFEYDTLFRR